MQRLPILDPQSFAIPLFVSTLIVGTCVGMLFTSWVDSEPMVYKTPKHISATLIQIDKPKPKQAKVEQKKPIAKPKPVKKAAPEPKAKTKPAPKPKPAPVKKEEPEVNLDPVPMPDFAEQLAQEEAQRADEREKQQQEQAKRAEEEQQAVADYTSQIVSLIQSVWRFPPSAKHDQVVVLKVFLVPTGEITEVQLLETSGNPALDRSAEQAVWKVGQLPVPKDVVLFEKQFRQIILKLQPENARL
ncbi:TonB family protein [Bermanella sp. R86510]|uniref:energy transducer TonB n=1 Tax=unclassified Bermanella TaxID=2627862 RepID=UPI0037CA4660